ncbi:hypothetical protein B0J13DRAFT_674727 [Dactylonectria estremocensis]|uniref:Uncharacterized protein n=1 Tax=Dactylonectria estremocensis TaxID=1079267 RepID=A0A9P9JB16_9HYPO|nr:hypothetical protein B0J13DRAFT_674727 [Dactylonectria estremocensis]
MVDPIEGDMVSVKAEDQDVQDDPRSRNKTCNSVVKQPQPRQALPEDLFDIIIHPQHHSSVLRDFQTFPIPKSWKGIQNLITHMDSWRMMDAGQASIIMPVILRHWLEDEHIRQDLLPIIRSSAREFLGATFNGQSMQLDIISEIGSQVSSVGEADGFTAKSASDIDSEKAGRGAKADAAYKRRIPKTNKRNIPSTMILQDRVHNTILFGTFGPFRFDFPQVHEAFIQCKKDCGSFIKAYDGQGILGVTEDGEEEEGYPEIIADDQHQGPLLLHCFSSSAVEARNDDVLGVVAVHTLPELGKFPSQLTLAFDVDYQRSLNLRPPNLSTDVEASSPQYLSMMKAFPRLRFTQSSKSGVNIPGISIEIP